MERRTLGRTGLTVSALGFGAGQIGEARLSDEDAGRLLNRALDLGVSFIDTARSYGLSEQRIGRHLEGRRAEYVLATKGGYGIEGIPEWTCECVTRGIEEALDRLETDVIDVFFLHSCAKEMLVRGEVIRALEAAKTAGKIRAAGYSGENEALEFAAECGSFDVLECSVNVCDQRVIAGPIKTAHARGLGVVAKRPIANAPWRFADRPNGDYCEAYWLRLRGMGWDTLRGTHDWAELMVRFAAFAPGVATAILGTSRVANLEHAVRAAKQGPLDAETLARVQNAFKTHDHGWIGQV
jgi:aryl-alcohol dehydrogenase-like predicted oxidoreductase